MDKPDTISADRSSQDFHGFMWDVTLDGLPVSRCVVASRQHGYIERYQDQEGDLVFGNDGWPLREVLYGSVDYERIEQQGA